MNRTLSWLCLSQAFVKVTHVSALYLCVMCVTLVLTTSAQADEIAVYDGVSLHSAMLTAKPGDEIVLYPGDYRGEKTESPEDRWHYFYSHKSGTASAPITLRSYSQGDIQELYGDNLSSAGYVLYLTGNYWRIKDLKIHTGQKGIMFDTANHNILDNIAVYNVRDEGVHFRKSSSNNILRNCHIYDTGRLKPGFGEAVYVGTHEGDRLADHSNSNRIGGCLFGPGVTAEAVDIKSGTFNTIVEHNVMNASGISGENFADSFIDLKGDEVFIRFNQMHWRGNQFMDHGIHILRREHQNSNIYNNEVTLDDDMPFIKIGRGTTHVANNRFNYSGPLFSSYGSGTVDSRLDRNLPSVHSYTGFRTGGRSELEPNPEPEGCLRLERDKKIEVDLNLHQCIEFSEELSERLLQVWDSNANKSCNFRGNVVSESSGSAWPITANYAGTRNFSGRLVRVVPTNGCDYLMMRWL